MDYVFIFYIFASAISIAGTSFYFFSASQPVAGGMLLLGTLIASIFFGLRWFTASGQTVGTPTGSWPPVINVCPDFLSLYTVGGKQVCVDPIGIGAGTGISKWTGPTQTDDRFLFKLHTEKIGEERLKALCSECETKKVTWEGVYDGSVCNYDATVPMPPPAPVTTAPAPAATTTTTPPVTTAR